jgi:acetate kinase
VRILVLNSGSSSIKYQLLYGNDQGEFILKTKGQVDRIGNNGSNIEQKTKEKETLVIEQPIANHLEGIDLILKLLIDPRHEVIQSLAEIDAIGHRVAHGGEFFKSSAVIDERAKTEIRKLFDLAPLHNPSNLEGIEAMESRLPGIPQVAVFDTAFHQTMSEEAFLYGIPYRLYKKHHIRRYGFHGTSHQFVAQRACKILGWDIAEKKIISCHLGNGASITAIDGGKSVETSMGFTPNYGLVMGTRSGVVDPGIIGFLVENEAMELPEVLEMLNKESGMKGMSNGLSSDMRDLAEAMRNGNPDAARALKSYAHRVKHYIGAYAVQMNGVDLVIMTGGIGENNETVRELCCSGLDFIGIHFDVSKNKGLYGKDAQLSTDCSKTKLMVVQTNEELVIAQETERLVNSNFN